MHDLLTQARLCNQLSSSSQPTSWSADVHPSILCGKNFNTEHYVQTFQPNMFILAMLIGTIHFCHIIPLSVALTLAWGHQVRRKQNFLIHISTEKDEIWCGDEAIQVKHPDCAFE